MSEPNNEAITFNGNGNPQPSDDGQPQGDPVQEQKSDQPEFVTREEYQRLQEQLKETEERAVSRAQGLVDTNAHRLQQEIQSALSQVEESIELAESSGAELTETQKEKMREKAERKVLRETPDQGDQEPGSPSSDSEDYQEQPGQGDPDVSKQQYDATSAAGIEIMRDVLGPQGVLTGNDPEAEKIDRSSRGKYLATLEQACEAKKARLMKQGSGTPTGAGMRGRQTNEPIGKKSPDEIWERIGL